MAKRDGLNVKMIDRLKEPGKYSDGRNLYLHVGANGSKSWLFIYRRLGKDKMRGLGSYRHVSLDEAREKAAEFRAMLRQGIEPPVSRGAVKKKDEGRTFAQLNERYLAEHKDSWRNPAKAESLWRNSLRDHAYTIIGEKDVKDIDVKDVHAVLSPIWLSKHPTAKKIRWRIGAVLAYAAALDLRPDVDLTRTGGKLDKLLPKAKRVHVVKGHDSMPFQQIPEFVPELRQREGTAAAALDFLILTAARQQEVCMAKWDQMDLDESVWNAPEEIMKAGRPHRVPLSPDAVAILKAMPRDRDDGFVFIGGRSGEPMSNMAMTAVLKRMGRKEGATIHGFRSTFRTWVAEKCLDVPREIAEAALAHTVGGVEGAYQRGDYFNIRRSLMERWADYCRSAGE
ncbi:tyrosine-type recombinase/integrase [Stakelama sp. CBK3Z-3]|uniref:Tyrosine-type recombinase/integrase n=1 Tax=Stakelama flava TaxID=2860338 RepID=A0ABS6XIT8_9SPHN|nr:site-specific integrase [Stakelama flava]MBW4330051.1 tyrosine-type recombinase/integrase [Stakelama flava]